MRTYKGLETQQIMQDNRSATYNNQKYNTFILKRVLVHTLLTETADHS